MTNRPRVRLVPVTEQLLCALQADRTRFAAMIGSPAPEGWPEFPEAVGGALEHLQTASDDDRPWSMRFFVDDTHGTLIGSGGYAGPPDDRTVEIGYEIAPEFRGRGLGSSAAQALVDDAVGTGLVDHVIAHTLPGPNPSTGVLASLGFAHVGEAHDPDAGTVWAWRWSRLA
ncbi:MAG: GNAT family protein [Gordonia sp. (in: high G+C Gram-positive bacteria)]|uniref:GNAT family N-acetyltransferase n=1 Tax=Gordonia sp. (in: high G+C Gram-positive bacteria) TaxID=84139 RepID=UPI0039E5C72E